MGRWIRLLSVTLGAAALIWAANPAVGTWRLNLAKSKYLPGPAPKSQTRIYAEVPGGIKATVTTVNEDGTKIEEEYPANNDRAAHQVTGNPDLDGVIMKRVDDFTAESTLIHAGVVIGTARRTVAPDGKTMTITYQGTLGGEKVNNVAVYDKQ